MVWTFVLERCLQAKGKEDMDKPHRAVISLMEVQCLLANGLAFCLEVGFASRREKGYKGLTIVDSVDQPVTASSMVVMTSGHLSRAVCSCLDSYHCAKQLSNLTDVSRHCSSHAALHMVPSKD